MIGTSIGTYRITAKLGAGGMGEVWRAHDSKLKRDVALKVLPEAFARDPERLVRFEREAEVLASLNHPNIAAIYGVAEDRALVMELVEGVEPKGPLPFDEAWAIASQIAAALEYAHEKGVVHRDLKPANIKITPDGQVKLLDFGLAKALSNQRETSPNADNSPTLTMAATEVGIILGTAAYMAPEQAKGKSVDNRADIWAFGVLLYELLTGDRLFKGEDVSETLAQVLTKTPDLNKVPAKTRKLLQRCLDKDSKKRLRDIAEASYLIEDAPTAADARQSKLLWAVAVATLLITLGILSFIHFRETPSSMPTLRYTVAAPERSTVHSFAISPDGSHLVIAAYAGGKRQLWLQPLDALQAQPMTLTEDATYPFWSPDSRYIAFFAQGKLKKVAARGGPPQTLCDAPNGRGGSWNRDDVIVFSPSNVGISIQRVPAAGGVPTDVMKAKGNQRFPVFLPDGRRFLYVVRAGTAEKSGIYVNSLDDKENRRILADVSGAVFAPAPDGSGKPGNILFVRENTLMAQPFDAASAQPKGEVFPVADGVALANSQSYAPATASYNGLLLYASGDTAGGNNQIAWVDRSGKLLAPVGAPGDVWDPALSPDEKSVAFRRGNGPESDLWLRDLGRGTETRITTDVSDNYTPFWSPKGDRIVFASNRNGGVYNLFQKTGGGSGKDEALVTNSINKYPTHWSRDGRFIVYYEIDGRNNRDVWVLPMDGSQKAGKPVPFLQTEFTEFMAQLSPDSHWMAYTSDQSGRREVYVRSFPRAEGQWTISVAGGQEPRWRGDGKELFFEAADGKMMAVPVNATTERKPQFDAGTPVALFDAHIAAGGPNNNLVEYDVTADGKRFLINTMRGSGATSSPPLNVLVNWQAQLKK